MRDYEKNLPTNEATPQTKIWIPRSEESGRSSIEPSSQSRPQAPFRLTFKKRERLCKRWEFRRVMREGKRQTTALLSLHVARGSSLRLGISVPGRYGTAPERNLFKRRMRELFRRYKEFLPSGLEIHIAPGKQAKEASFAILEAEFSLLLFCQHPR